MKSHLPHQYLNYWLIEILKANYTCQRLQPEVLPIAHDAVCNGTYGPVHIGAQPSALRTLQRPRPVGVLERRPQIVSEYAFGHVEKPVST